MELSDLVRARGRGALALIMIPVLAGWAGCHNGAAGGRASDGGSDREQDLVDKLPPPDADCPLDARGGNGVCPVNFCGAPKSVSTIPPNTVAALGADVICTPGYVCVPDGTTSGGTALQLRCMVPLAAAEAFGAACGKGAGATNRCKNDALCVEASPGVPFCSALCRADADCPKDAYCLEHKSDPLPNGSYVNLAFCTPKSKIAATVCAREADCPADQGCVSYGARTNLLACQTLGGSKSVGARCMKSSECRSGQCLDREGHIDANLSYCSAPCGKSSDCGADQRCELIVAANSNGTPDDPRDDTNLGICQSLFVPIAETGCKKDADCAGKKNGGDTCATKYGLCYTAGAASGAACVTDQECELGAGCNVNIFGGYCQTLGCAPGATPGSVDSCPGAHALCAQRAPDRPLYACYEGCFQSGDCARFKQNYVCEDPAGGPSRGGGSFDAGVDADGGAPDGDAGSDAVPVGICLYNQGA